MLDMRVVSNETLSDRCFLLKLTSGQALPEMLPGQFVQVRVDGSPSTFLRRPISIHYVDKERNALWLLVQTVGDGTRNLSILKVGDKLNLLLPLGNGFSSWENYSYKRPPLLVGGGVGVAPLLYLAACLLARGITPEIYLGARSKSDLVQVDCFKKYGQVRTITENEANEEGRKGFVTALLEECADRMVYVCGPKPMMQAVAKIVKQQGGDCEVSLENSMACGLGACLCCVEDTKEGNQCVCTKGPVFNINDLKWQI